MQTATPSSRRAAILELIEAGAVPSQVALAERLAARGIRVNQATLSRDLKALGVVKGPGGYRMPGGGPAADDPTGRLVQATRTWLTTATAAQNLLVLHTPPGGAQPLALAIDQARVDGIVGTLAGDDTVLVVAPDGKGAKRLARRFREMAA